MPMAVPSAIPPRRSLHDEIAARLRDMIIAGELKPGVKLNEAELALSFGVSRTPLREGLKQLAGEGLIEIIPNAAPSSPPCRRPRSPRCSRSWASMRGWRPNSPASA